MRVLNCDDECYFKKVGNITGKLLGNLCQQQAVGKQNDIQNELVRVVLNKFSFVLSGSPSGFGSESKNVLSLLLAKTLYAAV